MKTPRSFRKRVGPTLRCVGGARGKCVPVNLKEAFFCLLEYALSAVDEGRFFLFFLFQDRRAATGKLFQSFPNSTTGL